MSAVASTSASIKGFIVADLRGRIIGRVESPMYGSRPDEPDALAVRSGFLRGRRLVPATRSAQIDRARGVIGLSVDCASDPQVPLALQRSPASPARNDTAP